MNARDLFVSHSSTDAEVARELRKVLEGAGYSTWMAPDDIVGTETWTEQVLEAIESCKAMLVLVSAAANRSAHVSREVNLALGKGRAVLPVRIEDVSPEGSLEYLLSLVQRVEAFPPPVADHADAILRRVAAILRREEQPDGAAAQGAGPGGVAAASGPDAAVQPDTARSAGPDQDASTQPLDRRAAGIGPGSVVGGFVVESVLGEGGMATVFRARQPEPNRPVALKVIRSEHARNPTYRRRFLTEKEALASLEHPGIVPIHAAGDDGGVLYIAMRLVDGVDLRTRIANQGRLSIRETVDILAPIADAIDYAHEVGIVHGDLKPANVVLDRRGRAYLTDFGIGERVEGGPEASVEGMVMGTAEYLAPELATRGVAAISPSIDVYALGCLVFACLVGQPPFTGPTPTDVVARHVSEPVPSVRALRPEMPTAVDGLLARALAKDPAARFSTARELISGLELIAQAATAGSTQPVVLPEARTPEARARKWLGANMPVAVIGGSLAAIALVVAIVLGTGGPEPTPSPSRSAGGLPTSVATPSRATATAVVTPRVSSPVVTPIVNTAPTAVDDTPITFQSSSASAAYNLALMNNDADPDPGALIKYHDWTAPNIGTITGTVSCQYEGREQVCLRYVTGGAVGPFTATFYYRISDDHNTVSNYATVTVTFNQP